MEENIQPMASLTMRKNTQTDRKAYQKDYQKQYRKRKWRKEVVFDEKERKQVVKSAKKHQHKPAEHIRECTLAYINNAYLYPSEDVLKELRYELRKIGVNINQIAYKVNSNGEEVFSEMELHNKLTELESIIEQFVTAPINSEVLQETAIICRATIDDIHNTLS